MLLSKKTIRTLGFALASLALVFTVINVILAGISYRYAGPHFRPTPYHAVPQLQIASIVFTFFVLGLAYAAFAKPNINFTIVMSILMLISLLWNFAVAVYVLCAGGPGWRSIYEGCKMRYNGLLGSFHNIDTYLQEVDKNMCSQQCPCFISNTSGFSGNSTVTPFYNLWTKTTNPKGATAFQNCTNELQIFTFKEATRRDKNFDPEGTFDVVNFKDYFARLENDFGCTGWCDVEYFNPNYNQNVFISKYLFSDINRGPPVHFGCLNKLMEWLIPMLQAFGAIMIILVATQIGLLILGVCQAWAREKDHEKQIPHHHDDNRVI